MSVSSCVAPVVVVAQISVVPALYRVSAVVVMAEIAVWAADHNLMMVNGAGLYNDHLGRAGWTGDDDRWSCLVVAGTLGADIAVAIQDAA